MLKKIFGNFTVTDYVLWGFSVAAIILSAVLFGNSDALTLVATLFGVTSLIFYAKGNLVGPVLMFVFCVIYGIISYSYAYYGELITYVFMSLPMAVFTIVSWLKHPSKRINHRSKSMPCRLKKRCCRLLPLWSSPPCSISSCPLCIQQISCSAQFPSQQVLSPFISRFAAVRITRSAMPQTILF